MSRRILTFASLVLVAACAASPPPVMEAPVAVVVPASPDAGAGPSATEPLAIAQEPPGAGAPPTATMPSPDEEPKPQRAARAGGGPFDRGGANTLLIQVDPSICATPGGPRGPGHVVITFHPSGNVQSVRVDQPYFNTSSGACVASLFSSITVPSFSGGPVTVGKSFFIQ